MNIGTRPLCVKCKAKPRAYGYKKNNKIYWRRLCDTCNRKKWVTNKKRTNQDDRDAFKLMAIAEKTYKYKMI